MMRRGFVRTVLVAIFCLGFEVLGQTDSGDLAILEDFHKRLENSELLKWPLDSDKDPCGSKWPHVFCEDSRVTQIQVQNMGLSGPLPQNFNQLSMLNNIGLQRNNFSGKLPSFNGLSNLKYAYLGSNQFDTIPSDFFVGLTSLQVLSLDSNPLNQSTGWRLPPEFENSAQLMNLSLIDCNLVGPMPEFLGGMSSLSVLKLSYNSLTGDIPASLSGSALQILWLNNQKGTGLTGSIDVITSMVSLTDAWLHGNSFTGPIPDSIGALASLKRLWLNGNNLVGLVPENLTALPQLQDLQLQNNKLMGPIPEFSFPNFTYGSNSFCQSKPGVPCSPEVTALLDFLADLNYPLDLAGAWSGNDPCSSWRGVSCFDSKVSVLNLPNLKLNGTISPSIGKLDSLADIRLGGNNLTGQIPQSLTNLKSLKMLDVSSNNLAPPLPKFNGVKLNINGNPLLKNPSTPDQTPPPTPPPYGNPTPSTPPGVPSPPNEHRGNNSSNSPTHSEGSKKKNMVIYLVPVAVVVLIILPVSMSLYFCRKRANATAFSAPSSIVVHPRDPSDPDNVVKIAVASNTGTTSMGTSDLQSSMNSGTTEAHVIESGNLVVSVQILRGVTRNFSPDNELGRGGFGVVYKGELHDGTMIAVKRMEAAVISTKALDEFQSEIAVLSKVRHRNLVSLLGYSVEGNERLLVYEYLPQGALSTHLFQWEQFKMEPLSWKKRLNIALDVARAMEYLHNLAHQCFIHRDLKSSNILLGDDFRAKVSDFGLVKLAPDGKNSVVTRLAGTFGYLAPEYAVTGKITTKADVFSFGVVLMELVTGLIALDENRHEDKRYLASWFCQVKSNTHELRDAIDKSLDVTDETFESISIIAELAGHCAAREPHQRPDMGHAVNVLAPLVEKWKPMKDDQEEYLGIDLRQPLLQMVKGWQDADSTNVSSIGYNDSKGSIPSRPDGFAESFTSADGR